MWNELRIHRILLRNTLQISPKVAYVLTASRINGIKLTFSSAAPALRAANALSTAA